MVSARARNLAIAPGLRPAYPFANYIGHSADYNFPNVWISPAYPIANYIAYSAGYNRACDIISNRMRRRSLNADGA